MGLCGADETRSMEGLRPAEESWFKGRQGEAQMAERPEE